jgi:four helix bundle protein
MRNYDLKQRTYVFSVDVIKCCKIIGIDVYNRSIINQLIRSATSVGANYCEAVNSSSKKDMRNKFLSARRK